LSGTNGVADEPPVADSLSIFAEHSPLRIGWVRAHRSDDQSRWVDRQDADLNPVVL